MRTHTFRLDSDIMPLLHSRAMRQQLSVEDYINQQLRDMLNMSYVAMDDDKQERLSCINSLCGVLHDDGVPYETTKQEIMEERYGDL